MKKPIHDTGHIETLVMLVLAVLASPFAIRNKVAEWWTSQQKQHVPQHPYSGLDIVDPTWIPHLKKVPGLQRGFNFLKKHLT